MEQSSSKSWQKISKDLILNKCKIVSKVRFRKNGMLTFLFVLKKIGTNNIMMLGQ